MARLTQLRLVSVGHVRARFEDVLLDFRDSSGQAMESVLWLRNGGGKTSLLSLFFAGVCPHQRDFLGQRTGSGKRLSQYILPSDHGVVACQWELDAHRSLFDEEPPRYITGVFYKRESPTGPAPDGERGAVRRLYFAAMVSDDEPQLTIEGLPLFVEAAQAPLNRRTLEGFKRTWRSLRQQYPSHDVFVTDRQRDWAEQLKSRGIDPKLFFYQICMNEREGGASELFSFDDAEDFVDFLLEMTLDEQYAEQVRDQIATFRQELVFRNEQLKPERELCAGLLGQVTDFAGIAAERARVNDEVSTAFNELTGLTHWVRNRIESLQASCAEAESKARESCVAAEDAREQAKTLRVEAAALRRHACRLCHRHATAQFETSQQAMNQAARRETLWQAAVPLKRALDAERQAQRHRDELAQKQRAHAPLIERLRRTATELANALEFEAGRLRGLAHERGRAAKTERENARRHRSAAAEAGESAAKAEVEARQLQAALDEAKKESDSLVASGAMLPEESAIAADRRLTNDIDRLEQEQTGTRQEIDTRREEQEDCRTRREDGKARLAEARQERKQLEAAFQKAQQRRQSLERDAALLRLLEAPKVDLDAALTPAIKKAEEEKRRLLEAILMLRIDDMEDERAIVHLEESGILPPSRDVELLLDRLSSQRIQCWSGWSYVEKNVSGKDYRDVVNRWPYLVSGVVVATVDYNRAVEALQKKCPRLQSPVVVARADAMNEDVPVTWSVVGPTSDAHFDRSAGAREFNETHDRRTRREAEISATREWQESLEKLSHQLRSFREEFPRGWLDQNARERQKCEVEIETCRRLIDEAERRDKLLRSEIASLEDRQRTLADSCHVSRRHRDRVQAFFERHASKESARAEDRDRALERAKKSRSLQRSHQERADTCDQKAGQLDSEATRTEVRAGRLDEELTRVSHADQASRQAVAGDLTVLRDEYRLLERRYQEKVGSDTLRHLAEQKDADAARERQELARILAKTPEIAEADVAIELRALPSNQTAAEVYESAQTDLWAAKQRNGNDSQHLQRCEESLAGAEEACKELGLVDDPSQLEYPESAEEAEGQADARERDANEDDQIAAMYEKDAATHEEAIRDSRQRIAMLGKDLGNLEGIDGDNQPLIRRMGEMPEERKPSAVAEPTDDEDVEPRTANIRERLRKCTTDHDTLDARRDEVAAAVRRLVREDRYSKLTHSVARRFAEFTAAALESRAAYHVEKLELRLFHIDEKLKEADKQRDIVVRVILSAVDEALRLLTQVSRQSRLPQSLPGPGRQFLQIAPTVSENPADRQARINDLVDDLLEKGENLEPARLIQLAVRRVGSPIKVRLLHPDLDEVTQRVSITEMQRFSDGERLTCAILLYCTLARVRARQEGYAGNRSSVLLLDNPIGTASRVRFLDLQREVARAMNIQLIYATGVNDLDAVATLPNVIRLRNSRIDRRTGKRLVELDEFPDNDSDTSTQVEAVRVAFTRDHRNCGWQDGLDGEDDESV